MVAELPALKSESLDKMSSQKRQKNLARIALRAFEISHTGQNGEGSTKIKGNNNIEWLTVGVTVCANDTSQ